jgi:hypothetical protein
MTLKKQNRINIDNIFLIKKYHTIKHFSIIHMPLNLYKQKKMAKMEFEHHLLIQYFCYADF